MGANVYADTLSEGLTVRSYLTDTFNTQLSKLLKYTPQLSTEHTKYLCL